MEEDRVEIEGSITLDGTGKWLMRPSSVIQQVRTRAEVRFHQTTQTDADGEVTNHTLE